MKHAKRELPNIYEYNNFRNYLRDYQTMRQNGDPLFTKSHFSKLLGLPNTRSFFTDVLAGKTVTPAFVGRFVDVLNPGPDEARFRGTMNSTMTGHDTLSCKKCDCENIRTLAGIRMQWYFDSLEITFNTRK